MKTSLVSLLTLMVASMSLLLMSQQEVVGSPSKTDSTVNHFVGHFTNASTQHVTAAKSLSEVVIQFTDSFGETLLLWSEEIEAFDLTWQGTSVDDLVTFEISEGVYGFEGMFDEDVPGISGSVELQLDGSVFVYIEGSAVSTEWFTANGEGTLLSRKRCVCSGNQTIQCHQNDHCQSSKPCPLAVYGTCIWVSSGAPIVAWK